VKKLFRSEMFWILCVAVVLRFALLGIKPPHFDEGINGWFVDQMVKNGYYAYDPTNYHGPLYFYMLFASLETLGRNLWALRLPAVLASIFGVYWMFRFRDFFGRRCVAWAAAAMAVSPSSVFYGRYSIHESTLVLFMLIGAWGALGMLTDGQRKYFYGTVVGVTGMLLTKETWILHAGCFVAALGCLQVWQRVSPSVPPLTFPKQRWGRAQVAPTFLIAALIVIFFYSGNFLHFEGVTGLGKAYFAWFKTGTGAGGHIKTDYDLSWLHVRWFNYYWIWLIARYEWPVLVGLCACVLLLWPAAGAIRLIGIYACGVILGYSYIPYKTPWCIISLIWPFFLTFGWLMTKFRSRLIPVAGALLLLASLIWSVRLNFYHYADFSEPYVYVQTSSQVVVLTDPVLHLAAKDPNNRFMSGRILLDSYYPLPWIFGEFPHIGYYKEIPLAPDGDFIVIEKDKAQKLESRLTEPYYRREFQLRDAQGRAVVYFRAAKFAEEFHHAKPEVIPLGKP